MHTSKHVRNFRTFNLLLPIPPLQDRGGLVVRSQPWSRRAPGPRPDSTEDPPCMGPAARQIIRSGQTPSRWCGVEVWRGGASPGVALVM
ncbi:hypothetical protein AVEN_144271-1 [Araneus ventricosus]|uniref:Uncharacterized protein n=1 Tax=Araneus ventricosus TaxID=182803 RepID=A0A4Y2HAJ7_ARAVE|nr:hypothetical protein AVEN_144271-1 [Araneus ventricosus]